jgi:protease-4
LEDESMSEKRSRVGLGLVLVLAFLILVAAVAALAWWKGRETVAKATILEVDFDSALIEYVPEDPIAAFLLDKKMTVRDMVEALHAAAEDDDVVALVARVAPGGMGIAQIEELRDAVATFRAAGKPAVAYADTFGEVLPANGAYYLASAFDEIYIQPSGDVGLTGLRFESPFVAGTLEKLDIDAQFAQRHEYKNAMNLFTEAQYTEAHREAMQELADSVYTHLVGEIAEGRGMRPAQVRSAIDAGPFIGQAAVDAGFADALLYRDEVYDRVRALARGEVEPGDPVAPAATADAGEPGEPAGEAGEEEEEDGTHLLYLPKYWHRVDGPWQKGDDVVAVVYGIGGVVRGESQYDPFSGDLAMGGESVAKALRDAVDDDDVKAIILRVDSPGGSYVASDMIWREVVRAREAGKPVIASMSNLAASGGYFVSMAADKIVSQPSTITGSIGVLGGKMVTRETWNRIGLTWDSVQTAEHAEMWSSLEPFDPDEWDKFNAWLDRVYEDFTSKVAEGRNLPKERVLEIAKGRVWSGVDALELGLVDELGGFPTAIRLAREAAGIEADAKVRLVEFPKKKSPFEALFAEGPQNSEDAARAALVRTLEAVQPMARTAQRLGLYEPVPGVLMMPEIVTGP